MNESPSIFDRTEWVIGDPPDLKTLLATGKRWFLLIDETVGNLHTKWVEILRTIHPGCAGVLTIPSGEGSKSVEQWSRLTSDLLSAGIRRNDVIVAAGGGVTGDLAGFVASTTLRGVSLVHVPTTLLAMVDSSIGGKTGINHSTGKNLIGTFHPAEKIHIDLAFLRTLPLSEWVNGFAELVKYGFISDPTLLDRLESAWKVVLGADSKDLSGGSLCTSIPHEMASIVETAWSIKQDIVKRDGRESGVRMFLNYGHTFAHALENTAGYGRISHGTAVLVGMICAQQPSLNQGNSSQIDRIMPYLTNSDLLPILEKIDIKTLMSAMGRDKKNRSEAIRLILLESPGHPIIVEVKDLDRIEQAWKDGFTRIREWFT